MEGSPRQSGGGAQKRVALLFGEPTAAWKRVVSPTDVVGIKSNVWSNLPTPPVLEEAIQSEVINVGVNSKNVAVDATGARILQAKRDLYFGKPSPISPPAHHIEFAGSRYGLGVSDPDAIDLVRLGWQDEALI